MTGHGGPRSGSGRKQTLGYIDRLHVGARAVNFQKKIAERRAFASFNEAAKASGLREAQAQSVSILRSEGREHWESSFEGEDAREAVGFSLMTLNGLSVDTEPEEAPRVVSIRPSSYATRDHVYAVVSRWATWYFGVKITPRKIRDCWIEYRQFQRET